MLHPEFRAAGLGHGVDLALLELARPVEGARPAERFREGIVVGRVAISVGYGVGGTSSTVLTAPQPTGIKRAGTNVIDQIGGMVDGRRLPDNFLIADFDAPGEPERNRTGDAHPTELEYLPLGGDSGGGLFIDVDGSMRLAGIVSATTPRIPDDPSRGLYGSLVYWVQLSPYNAWIDEVTASR